MFLMSRINISNGFNLFYEGNKYSFDFEVNPKSINVFVCRDKKLISFFFKSVTGLNPEISPSENELNKTCYIGEKNFVFSWLNVFENVRFGNENKSDEEINSVIGYVGLAGYESHYSINRSYGFNLRVALARIILSDFDVVFLDGSLNFINQKYKFELYNLILKIVKDYSISFIVNSDEIKEAVFLAENIFTFDEERQLVKIPISFDVSRDIQLYNSDVLRKKLSELILNQTALNF